MKKIVFVRIFSLLLPLLVLHSDLRAQQLVFLFGHALYNIPVNSYFKNNYSYGLGVEGGAGIGIGSFFIIGTVGYSQFESYSANKAGNYSYVPIKGGIRKYLLIGKILFFQADAGVGVVKNQIVNSSRFSADVGLGVKLGPFEVLADYDGFTAGGVEPSGYLSWIGIKAGMRLGL